MVDFFSFSKSSSGMTGDPTPIRNLVGFGCSAAYSGNLSVTDLKVEDY